MLQANKEMRSQKYYLSFNLTLSYCYELKVSRSIENHLGFDHMLDQMSDCLFWSSLWSPVGFPVWSYLWLFWSSVWLFWSSVWSPVYLWLCRQEAPPAGISTRSEPQFSISWTNGRAGDADDDGDDNDVDGDGAVGDDIYYDDDHGINDEDNDGDGVLNQSSCCRGQMMEQVRWCYFFGG